MSNDSVNHQTHGDVAGDGGGGGGGGGRKNTLQKKNRSGYGRKAKRVVLSRIKPTKNKDRPSISPRSSSRCCLFVKRIPNSCTESPTSDPNSSEFTFDSLRVLIEKSDFLLNECNTHLDVDIPDG